MKRQPPKVQIVLDEPRDVFFDPELEEIILDEETVNDDRELEEPGCLFDPIWEEG